MGLNAYGNNNPPYTLYQAPDGKWGLMDKNGIKLPAEFQRTDEDDFSRVPWETVTFNEQEGWDLLAWYDPDEVWFNFTFDDSAYHPEKWGGFLWKQERGVIDDYIPVYLDNLPEKDAWLIHILSDYYHRIKEIEERKPDDDDRDMGEMMQRFLSSYPELNHFAGLNDRLSPILDNPAIPEDAKVVLWCGKVSLDYELRYYLKIDTYDE